MMLPAITLTLLGGLAATNPQADARAPGASPRQSHREPAPEVSAAGQTTPRGDRDATSVPAETQYLDRNGDPFPPEIQRQLREALRTSPLPVADPAAAKPPARPDAADGDIEVIAQRPRGSVVGDIPPQQTFSPLDIRAYGASNIGELLENLQSQVSSNRGRDDNGPITLLNGRRISDFTEIARIPTEAIERMEIFPEEVALRYGYRADQKVVNIVTFERFQSRTGQANFLLPTEGGRTTGTILSDYFAIRNDTRYSLGGDYNRSAALLESQREVVQLAGSPDVARFRTLLPENERLALSGLASGNLFGDVSSTLNARFETNAAASLLGVGNGGPITRDLDTRSIHLGASLNGREGAWIWSLTGNYDRATNDIATDTGDVSRVRDTARSVNALADVDLVFSGPLAQLPAGPVSATFRGGIATRDFTSESLLGGIERQTGLARDRGAVQISLDLPITGRRGGATPALGALTLNANFEAEHLSDVGTLRTLGYGLTWSPIDAIDVVASATDEEGAPSVEQLGGPLVVTPNIRTYDFTRREVVDVTRVFGGNPNLRFDNRHVARFGLNAKPMPAIDLTLSVDYVATRTDDAIAPFPIATPQIEAAFPQRFTRDIDGRLLQIDTSPLNFEKAEQRQVRLGINFTRPLGPVPSGAQGGTGRFFSSEADMRRSLPPGARVVTAPGGSPLARRLENMTSRMFFSLYHTWFLQDEIQPREGGPTLDLLGGAATDFRGGRRRHEIEFQAGVFKRGLGARVTANWQSATRVQGLGGAAGDLGFADFGTVSVNLFANLADYLGASSPAWLKATRLSMGVTNLLNTRPQVRDDAGLTPISYQPAYLDPTGRLVSLSVRKVF